MRISEATVGAIAAFALNWVWENAQAPLYKGYAGFAQDVWMCTVATVGDLAIVAVIWSLIALAYRDPAWHRRASLGPYGLAVLVGVAMAVAIEYWALATGRWTYAEMPLVPYTRVGLLPVAQMLLIPPAAFVLMRLCERAKRSAAGIETPLDR